MGQNDRRTAQAFTGEVAEARQDAAAVIAVMRAVRGAGSPAETARATVRAVGLLVSQAMAAHRVAVGSV